MSTLRSITREAVNQLVAPFGVSIVSQEQLRIMRQQLERLVPAHGRSRATGALPEGAADYLRTDNPRLAELRSRYQNFDCPASRHSLWTDGHRAQIDLQYFRGDNPYLFQIRDDNREIHYLLTYFYLKSVDVLDLLQRFKEDDLFGVYTFDSGKGSSVISRDLLDSASEITFLEETIGISQIPGLCVLDIGAGYGRMGYRLSSALSNLDRIFCTDAVAESTFLCEYYLKFRGVTERARAVPLDEIEAAAAQKNVQLAMNIHSFSECSLAAVQWWLDLVSKNRIRYLFIVPNADNAEGASLWTTEEGQSKRDFLSAIVSRGYRLVQKRPKYSVPALQKYGVTPTHYYLFELESA